MSERTCPICEAPAQYECPAGDWKTVNCTECGWYRLSGTLLRLVEKEDRSWPDPVRFRSHLADRRVSEDCPLVTTHDDLW